MFILNFQVSGQRLTKLNEGYLVERSLNYVGCEFKFQGEEWEGCAKTAFFKNSMKGKERKRFLTDDGFCYVPPEVLIGKASIIVSVVGEKENYRITTGTETFSLNDTLYSGELSSDPTPSQYEQIIAIMQETKEIAESVREDADAGKFDGEKGDKGDTGDTGEKGADGKDGKDGADGKNATIAIGNVTTGEPNTPAVVTNSGTEQDAIFNFVIPQGMQGERGEQGETGKAATIRVGTVTTGAAGSEVSVTNSGTENAAVLDFASPKGEKGDTGENGKNGADATDEQVQIAVNQYMSDNPIPVTPVDVTLTKEGEAADAKATGKKLQELYEVKANVIVETAKGENILLQDSAAAKFKNLRLFGKSEQQTTTGAQLLEIQDGDFDGSDLQINAKSGVITINGTPIDNAYNQIIATYIAEKSGMCYLSAQKSGMDSHIRLIYSINDGTLVNSEDIPSFALIEGDKLDVRLRIDEIKEYSDFIIIPMLNAGSSALPLEPYTGGKPSPSPEQPSEIKNVGESGTVSIVISDSNEEQSDVFSVQISGGLYGIPVLRGGNYTDGNRQQWVCNFIDFTRRKYVQYVKSFVINADSVINSMNPYVTNRSHQHYRYNTEYNFIQTSYILSNRFICYANEGESSWNDNKDSIGIVEKEGIDFNIQNNILGATEETQHEESVQLLKEWLKDKEIIVYAQLETPIEIDLTEEQLPSFAEMKTYYPTTRIQNDSNAGMEVEYVADTKNYIDKKFVELEEKLTNTNTELLKRS